MLRYCTAGKQGDHRFSHGSWRTIPLRQQMMKLALPVTGIEAMHVRFWVDYSVPAALRLLSFSSSQLGSFPLPLLVAPAMAHVSWCKKKRDVFIFQKFPEFTLTCPRYPKLNIHKSTSWFVSLRFATFSPHHTGATGTPRPKRAVFESRACRLPRSARLAGGWPGGLGGENPHPMAVGCPCVFTLWQLKWFAMENHALKMINNIYIYHMCIYIYTHYNIYIYCKSLNWMGHFAWWKWWRIMCKEAKHGPMFGVMAASRKSQPSWAAYNSKRSIFDKFNSQWISMVYDGI